MIEAGTSKSSVSLVGHQHAAMIKKTYPDDGEAFAQHVGDLAGNADAFLNRIDGIEKSHFYTRPGLVKPVSDEGTAYLAGLRAFRRLRIDPLDAQERALMAEASAPPPSAPEDKVLKFLRHEAIRARVEKIADPVDRQLLITKAAARGDRDFVDAVAGANPAFELVPAEVIAKARQRMVAAASPELVRVQTLRDTYAQVLAVASEELKNVLTRFGIDLNAQ